ncbi:MAG: L-tyrosine/L-tryptophan isonitrile synthase family protein [bacterium]|nr:L-tyrosine/L-tryptophan isonitrile synthase family protein [bacterium]
MKEILRIYHINQKEGPPINQFLRQGRPLFKPDISSGDLSSAIFDLLSNKTIRRGPTDYIYSESENYTKKIDFFVKENRPVEFVFQGFPFKCHNPMETCRQTPDLGELAFLTRLLDINATVKQIYQPGVSFTILAEGHAYSHLFGASSNEVDIFDKGLKHFVSLLNANDVISFVDFNERLKVSNDFDYIYKDQEQKLKAEKNPETQKEVERFIPVMMRSATMIEGIALDDLAAIYNGDELSLNQKELNSQLLDEARELAIRYTAFKKAQGLVAVIPESFPEKLYISVISRPGRYGFHPIHRKTRYLPHHGVPVLESDKVDIVFFQEIIKNPASYTAVFCPNDSEEAPFYFIKEQRHKKC